MINFFDAISSAFDVLLQFLNNIIVFFNNFVAGLYSAIAVLMNVATLPIQLAGQVPLVITTAVTCFISLAVLKFILGR